MNNTSNCDHPPSKQIVERGTIYGWGYSTDKTYDQKVKIKYCGLCGKLLTKH